MKKTKIEKATKKDKDNYLEILKETGAMFILDKNGRINIEESRSEKYRNIMKPLREEKKRQRLEELETLGQGIIFLLTQMPRVNGWKC